jgi:hypothetical protein
MGLAIDGGYAPYGYMFLLQAPLLHLQRFGLGQFMSKPHNQVPINDWAEAYCAITRIMGSAVACGSWMIGAYVAYRFTIAGGVLLFALGVGTSVLLALIVPASPKLDLPAHLISIPITLYLLRALLMSVGLIAV